MKLLPGWLRRWSGDGRPSPAGRFPVLQIDTTSRCQMVSVSPVSFGHVSQGLMAAFHSQEAEKFKALLRRLKMSTHPALMFSALATEADYATSDHVSGLPGGCQSCHKQYGM